jgi:hypothetical protein
MMALRIATSISALVRSLSMALLSDFKQQSNAGV